MSFKRAGDDHCALRIQKKQRVTDLFAEDIPADEASQTRSGRFVCLVCPHNPVLDTMAMLVLHRQGKKHLANVTIKIEKDHNLTELLQKRKQEMYLSREKADSSSSVSGNSQTLQVSKDACEAAPLLERTRQLTKAIRENNQRKAYNKGRDEILNDQVCSGKRMKAKPFFQSKVEILLSEKLEKTSQGKIFEGNTMYTNSSNMEHPSQDKCESASGPNLKKTSLNDIEKKKVVGNSLKGKETTKEQQRYLELRMSGWILDQEGKWVKDESVEFDSDEEEPS